MPPKPFLRRDVPSRVQRPKSLTERVRTLELDIIDAFVLFSSVNVIFSFYSPIQDCDEVFNYWEPTHYLNHGNGLQTWEYSPEFAIRSWFYITIHALPTYFVSFVPVIRARVVQFYFLRLALGLVTAFCEARLFVSIRRCVGPIVALLFMTSLLSSPGMFHASVAYLPSTFAMWTTALAVAEFADWRGGSRTAWGLLWLAVGTIIGWPFIGVLALPFLVEELALALVGGGLFEMLQRFIDGFTRSVIVLGLEISVDTFFYKVYECIPYNIVRYNVFSSAGKGPDIYGTEPWYFYINNLLINFNLWFALAALSFPLVVFQNYIRERASSRFTFFRTIIFISPFYLWLTIFTLQPHKEERFMYPIYPCLAFNAAVSMQIIYLNLRDSGPKGLLGKIPPSLKLFCFSALTFTAVFVGVWRTLGLATAYTAPLEVYRALYNEPGLTRPSALSSKYAVANVCVGKEWYRFPSHYHLPASTRLKFVRSDFRGLLPGEFSGRRIGYGVFPGASLMPSGLNDMNIEDPGKYTQVSLCDYMVDSYFPLDQSPRSPLEPDYVLDTKNWEQVKCLPFLDAGRTPLLGRLFWIPDTWNERVPAAMQRKWGSYCLLRRKT